MVRGYPVKDTCKVLQGKILRNLNRRKFFSLLIGFVDQFITEKVNQWKEELMLLMDIAKTQPHAAYAAFTHGYVHRFASLCRTVPNIEHSLQPLEESIRSQLIPTITSLYLDRTAHIVVLLGRHTLSCMLYSYIAAYRACP